MGIKIALAGNPNSGKTTLFNALTGSNQFVGNWPGVTVEKKEGKLKGFDDVTITDLPGIYSLSPYTLEEVVARNYLITERPDAILNIVDGTNLERNLYLTTQLTELGIPVVIALNMIDLIEKKGDFINVEELSRQLGCKVVSISALKGTNIQQAAEAAVKAAKETKTVSISTLIGAGVNTVCNFVFIYIWGAIGAAFATMIGYITTWIVRTYYLKKISKMKIEHIPNIASYILIIAVSILATYGIEYLIQFLLVLIIFIINWKTVVGLISPIRQKIKQR